MQSYKKRQFKRDLKRAMPEFVFGVVLVVLSVLSLAVFIN